MNPNKALWEKGDFAQIADLMRGSGEAFVAALEIEPPIRVLDLGCGDGTTAVPLARLGAEVTGVGENSFDLTLSMFGAMFAPRPFDAASEMVRVTKPGGRIVMGNWIPNDPTFVAQVLKISSSFVPPPEGSVSPMTWGVDTHVVERFGKAGIPQEGISFAKDDLSPSDCGSMNRNRSAGMFN